ncbi:hypothetical protein D9M68_865350 [compost metagenome]
MKASCFRVSSASLACCAWMAVLAFTMPAASCCSWLARLSVLMPALSSLVRRLARRWLWSWCLPLSVCTAAVVPLMSSL